MGIELNKGQKELVELGEKWFRKGSKQTLEIDGAAGTGKSTVVKAIIDKLGLKSHEVLFVTYTGKAALELTKKGCKTYTIHSSFYELIEEHRLDDNNKPMYKLGRPVMVYKFKRKEFVSKCIKLVVVDEAGMIPENMRDDIMFFDIPVIALGDLLQLPPIFGKPAFLQQVDYTLTEIMRQAKGDPIVHLATLARNQRYIRDGSYGKKCHVISKNDLNDDMLKYSDMIICGKNDTRHKLNHYYRRNILGIDSAYPILGDKLICRKNNWQLTSDIDDYPLINGMIGTCLNNIDYNNYTLGGNAYINFRPDFTEDDLFSDLEIDLNYITDFSKDKYSSNKYRFSYTAKMEFGYAITGHLSQGSQYDSVLIYNEYLGGNIYNRWLYTVLTRAKEFLILAR